jgi:small subunit ribosomal protein S6
MREYETMIIAKPDLPESEMSKMVAKIEGIMTSSGGQIIKKDAWGVRRLAYPIGKTTRGIYFVYDIAATQADVTELERVLKLDEAVIRSLSIKISDNVNVETRKVELQKLAEAAALRAAEAARDRADGDSFSARRQM